MTVRRAVLDGVAVGVVVVRSDATGTEAGYQAVAQRYAGLGRGGS